MHLLGSWSLKGALAKFGDERDDGDDTDKGGDEDARHSEAWVRRRKLRTVVSERHSECKNSGSLG